MNTKDTNLIRNSTSEFLIFTDQASEQSIGTLYGDEMLWLSQKLMAESFAVDARLSEWSSRPALLPTDGSSARCRWAEPSATTAISRVTVMVHELVLQRSPEALYRRIVETVPLA